MSYFASKTRYDKMSYNRCGNSGLLLPAVSLGLWHNFGGVDDYQNMKDILLRAFDLGITPVSYTHLTLPTTIELWGGGGGRED